MQAFFTFDWRLVKLLAVSYGLVRSCTKEGNWVACWWSECGITGVLFPNPQSGRAFKMFAVFMKQYLALPRRLLFPDSHWSKNLEMTISFQSKKKIQIKVVG